MRIWQRKSRTYCYNTKLNDMDADEPYFKFDYIETKCIFIQYKTRSTTVLILSCELVYIYNRTVGNSFHSIRLRNDERSEGIKKNLRKEASSNSFCIFC